MTAPQSKRDQLMALCREIHPHYYHEACGSINILLSGYAAICQDQVNAMVDIREIAHHYLDHSMGIHFMINMEPVTHGFIQSVVRVIQGPHKNPDTTTLQSLYTVPAKLGRLIDATNDPDQWLAAVYSFQNDVWAEIVEYWIGVVSSLSNPREVGSFVHTYASASVDELIRSLYHYHGAFSLHHNQERDFRHILFRFMIGLHSIYNQFVTILAVEHFGSKTFAKQQRKETCRKISVHTRSMATEMMAFFDSIAVKAQNEVVHLYEQHPLIPTIQTCLPLYRALCNPDVRSNERAVNKAIGDFVRAVTANAEACYLETLEYRGVKEHHG